MKCYRDGGCGLYEMLSCSECPASKPSYSKDRTVNTRDFYKVVCKAEDYPIEHPRIHKLSTGDSIVLFDNTHVVKPGDSYMDYPAYVSQVFYEPRKWWQFWKKKKQLGYVVVWE